MNRREFIGGSAAVLAAASMPVMAAAAQAPKRVDLVITSDTVDLNLRSLYDALYPEPSPGQTIVCTINEGVRLTNLKRSVPCFDIGQWPPGTVIELVMHGKIGN